MAGLRGQTVILVTALVLLARAGEATAQVPAPGGTISASCRVNGGGVFPQSEAGVGVDLSAANNTNQQVVFTWTMLANPFFGPTHVHAVRSVGAGFGISVQPLVSTGGLPAGSGTVRVEITSNVTGSTLVGSCQADVTVVAPPQNVTAPSIQGHPQRGQTLACSPGAWSPAPDVMSVQWLRGGLTVADGSQYVPGAADVGQALACRVRATGFGGTSTAASAAVQVLPLPPANQAPPAITVSSPAVTPSPGDTLTCGAGTWDASPTSFAFAWLRDGLVVLGQTAPVYTLTPADRAQQFACRVIASNAGGAGTAARSQVVNVAPACVDADGDGSRDDDADALCDNWEVDQFGGVPGGLDFDGNGLPDLRLSAIDVNGDGAVDASERSDPERDDFFVETDYMVGDGFDHKPAPVVLADVQSGFANGPGGGIRLHLSLDEAIPLQTPISFPGSGAVSFSGIKAVRFGTVAQRLSPAVLAAKRFAYHYLLIAHSRPAGDTGRAEVGGNDAVVSLGGFPGGVGTNDAQAGTIMHELGHNLGLRHAGATEEPNCNPNYLSVMSYTRQIRYDPIDDPLAFSRNKLASLDEKQLDETKGIGGPASLDTAFADPANPDVPVVVGAGGAINWDQDGDGGESAVEADINRLPSVGCSAAGLVVIDGYDDWDNMDFDFRDDPLVFEAARPSPRKELTYRQARAMSPDSDRDRVLNIDDNCPLRRNRRQRDGDGDGIGGACEPRGTAKFRGTLVRLDRQRETLVINVTGGSNRRADQFAGRSIAFDVGEARFAVPDRNRNRRRTVADVRGDDVVRVESKLARGDRQPFKATRVVGPVPLFAP